MNATPVHHADPGVTVPTCADGTRLPELLTIPADSYYPLYAQCIECAQPIRCKRPGAAWQHTELNICGCGAGHPANGTRCAICEGWATPALAQSAANAERTFAYIDAANC